MAAAPPTARCALGSILNAQGLDDGSTENDCASGDAVLLRVYDAGGEFQRACAHPSPAP